MDQQYPQAIFVKREIDKSDSNLVWYHGHEKPAYHAQKDEKVLVAVYKLEKMVEIVTKPVVQDVVVR